MATSSFTISDTQETTQIVENGTGIVTESGLLNPANAHAIIARGDANIQIDGTINVFDNDRKSLSDSLAIRLEDAVLNLNVDENGILETSGGPSPSDLLTGTITGDSSITNLGTMRSDRPSSVNIQDATGDSDLLVNNSGTINLDAFSYDSDTGRFVVENSGFLNLLISSSSRKNADGPAMVINNTGELGRVLFTSREDSGATSQLYNSGTVSGTYGSDENHHPQPYDELPENGNIVINSGTMLGGVRFGGLSDFYDGREGVVRQEIFPEGADVRAGYGNDTLLGGAEGEHFKGEVGDDTLEGNGGDDLLDGGEGNDTALYSGNAEDYIFTLNEDGSTSVTNTASAQSDTGTDTLVDIEQVKFADAEMAVALDTLYGDTPPTDPDTIDDDASQTQYLSGDGNTVFAIDGNAEEYGWGPTEDGTGTVVWHKENHSHDILWDFKSISFNDQRIEIADEEPVNEVDDIAGETQYLVGSEGKDRFVIDGEASNYGWDQTDDGSGIVVWNQESHTHDILWDYEEIAFNETVTIAEIA